MDTELSAHLFNLAFLAIAVASLVFVFLAEGARRDIYGISRGILLRLGPIAIVFLLVATITGLVGTEAPSAAGLLLRATVALLLFAVACLFLLALYFLRITLALTHVRNAVILLDRWPLWLLPFIVSAGITVWCWISYDWLSTAHFALIGFCAGYLVSLSALRKYLLYGFSQYEEALSATEWYEKLVAFANEAQELYITAITPGLVLPSEFDSAGYPVAGQAATPVRKALFETYFTRASAGLRIRCVFDERATVKVIQAYRRLGVYDRYRIVSHELLLRLISTGNIEIRYRQLESKSEFRRASVAADMGVMFSERSESPLQKIRHGEIVLDKSLATRTILRFMQEGHWDDAEQLTPVSLDLLWDSALVGPLSDRDQTV